MDRKITVSAAAGTPIAMVIAWGWNAAFPETPMPAEVAAAIGSLVTVIVGWIVPNKVA